MEHDLGDDSFKSLYRFGAGAAIGVLALVPVQMAVFLIWPLPDSVVGWFELFRANPLVGLLDLDLLMIVDTALLAVMFLAVFAALRRASPSLLVPAVAFELVGVATYFASNTAFEMLTLSRRWAAADAEAQRVIVAAGETMIATWQGTAFDVSYVLSAIVILLTSTMMLRSQVFGRVVAYVGLLFGALSVVPASAGKPGLILSIASLVPMWIWLALIARKLLQLGRGAAVQGSDRPEAGARPHRLVPQH